MGKKANTEGGKPAKPKSDNPVEVAAINLQYAVDRANNFIHDGGTSFSRRVKAAARLGIPRETVLKGLASMQDALRDCAAHIDSVYAAPEQRTSVKRSRVDLMNSTQA